MAGCTMSKVVSLCTKRKEKEAVVADDGMHEMINGEGGVLDVMDEFFPEGSVVLGYEDGEVIVASSTYDRDMITQLLETALKMVKED